MKKHFKNSMGRISIAIAVSVLMICAIASFYTDDNMYPIILIGSASILTAYGIVFSRRNKKTFDEYVEMIASQKEGMSGDAISKFPLPMAVLKINGQISWYNNLFSEMLGSDNLYNLVIGDVMPDLKWSEILKSSQEINMYASYKGHKYNIVGDIIKNNQVSDEKPDYTVLLYFIDKTETENLKKRYDDEKTDIAIVNIDNYDEIFQKMDDTDCQQTMAKINKYISTWVSESNGVMKKTERDRYLVMFEHKYLKEYIQRKFDILEKVRKLGESMKMPITVSIGIGIGGTLTENEEYARAALDMTLGRGGDQASVKDSGQYTFYGGISKDYEKSTRVKTRAFAVALKDFIVNSDKVIFMGHTGLDYDALGSAIGLSRAVRSLGKEPYIVYDHSPAVSKLYNEAQEIEEYRGMFISTDNASDMATSDTLLIILDTHRPSMLPAPELLDITSKVALLDHHRRSTDFITGASLVYHEPYASSTCEMVTETIQYIDGNNKLTAFEAKSLYVGILMDSKNFTVKTGVRTFESASFLRRYGLNTADVRRLFNSDKDEYIKRAEIIKNSVTINDNMLISVCRAAYPNMRVISSKAADEMLNLNGIRAAFVIYPHDNEVCVSARSLGDVNVQLIAEKLGGGGHSTVAGTQIKTKDLDAVYESLENAINEYIEENRKD